MITIRNKIDMLRPGKRVIPEFEQRNNNQRNMTKKEYRFQEKREVALEKTIDFYFI